MGYSIWPFTIMSLMMTVSAFSAAAEVQFDDGWRFTRGDPPGAAAASLDDAQWTAVDLPHDWSIAGPIAADNPTGSSGGFFPAGVGWYRKTFVAPQEWSGKHVTIQFDGVYMRSEVWINGTGLGTHVYGFTPFAYDLTRHLRLGAANTIAVRVDNSRQPNCRWYSGSGIYRHVRLDVRDPIHIARYGACVRVEEASDDAARLSLSVTAENTGSEPDPVVGFATAIYEAGADGKPAGNPVANFDPVEGRFKRAGHEPQKVFTVQTRATVRQPKLWSPETPALYVAVTTASVGGRVVDVRETMFGVRTIAVSAERGFELNGKPLKMFGACVHDDNGPLGVAAFDRAEERRVEILKSAGFNAVRCAHNPPAPAFLDACDRLGLLVINEAFDSWEYGKLPQDYSRDFEANWQSDFDAMILRDRNHPSIVMWSLGNEIHDFGSPQGLRNGIKLVERARALDPTRFTNSAVFWYPGIGGPHHWKWDQADELMSKLDIVGYNYAIYRYDADHQRVPARVMVGTESYPRDLFASWASVTDRTYLIGDFVWTGIDYLGESGIGRFHGPDEKIYFHTDPRHFPYHGAYCGDIDITGFRKPVSYARNIIWNRGERLYTSITEMTTDGRKLRVGDWGVVPSRASWTWPGYEGRTMEVQVYSRYDAVRLYLNDMLIGEKPTTRAQEFKALFDVPYAPGSLRTAGVQNGNEVESNVLRTAGPVAALRLTADRTAIAADGQDLCFITVESVDREGNLQPTGDQTVTFDLSGEGSITGVASGDYGQLEGYQGTQRQLFQGRAQVVIRSTRRAGAAEVRASADGLPDVRLRIATH